MRELRPLEVPLQGRQLIEASAGTGKTFAITTLALRAVVEREIDIARILIVTFTNAATAELRRRLRERLHRALAAYADAAAARDDEDLRAFVAARSAAGHADSDRRRLRLALDGFDEAAIFTIHGFCQRALREFAFESGAAFDAEMIGDPFPLLVDAVRDLWSARCFAASTDELAELQARRVSLATVTTIAGAFALHRDLRVRTAPADVTADAATAWVRAFVRDAGPQVLATLDRRKRAANVQDFDDLLRLLADALEGPFADDLARGLGRRYGIALIDEFQDTDPVQYRIFRELHARAGTPLFLIGDPKQAIYAFRGADVFAYLAAQRAASDAHTLRTNWRSAPRLVAAVNALFSNAPQPFVIEDIAFRPGTAAARNACTLGGGDGGGAPLRIAFARRADHGVETTKPFAKGELDKWLYRAVADRLVELLDGRLTLDGRPLRPGDIAVLCRKNDQLFRVGEALRGAGIPSVALGDASVFESLDAEMLEHVLRALADPGDAMALRAALVTPIVGCDSETIARLNADEAEWDAWADRFHGWSERWRTNGFTAALRGVFEDLAVPERVLGQPGGERSLTNLLHLGELLQQAASEGRRGPHGLVDWLHRLRVDQPLRNELGSEAAQIRLESDAHAVSLITVHKSKGLEYPVVVCPFLWDTIDPKEDRHWPCFHDAEGQFTIDLGVPPAPDSVERRAREVAAEDARLLYVALTRAKQLCLLVWGNVKFFERSALASMLHRHPRRNADPALRRDAKQVRGLSDDEIAADLAALAEAADGGIAVEALPPPRGLRHAGAPPDGTALVAPPAVPPVGQAWRVGSFTSLSAGGEVLGARAEEEGRDRDEIAAEAGPSTGASAGLQGFPRGRGPGVLVHRILEAVDFAIADADLREVVARELTAARIGSEWIDPLTGALRDVLDTPLLLGGDAVRLRDVPRARRLSEMEFAYPVARAAGRTPLSAAALADVFARHGGAGLGAYADRLRRLPFRPLAGFLRGYIDCVFAHGGRWYVVDYKTNDLGPRAADYAPAALAAEMTRHDYVLQYHLYLVALHRYLRHRLPGYDYARDCGGALYLFLRGMAPARGPATGVVHAQPSAALIVALSEVLAG